VTRDRGGSIERLKPYGGYGDPNVVFHLYEDPQGNVWFAQSGNLYQATATGFQLPTTWFSPHEVSLKTVTINFGASLMDYLHGASG
jgi:LPS sulfotransferase NodH